MTSEIVVMEITQEEAEMILTKREAEKRKAKREGYVAELNDIIARAKADGFIIAADHSFKCCENVKSAVCWNDAAGRYIGLL